MTAPLLATRVRRARASSACPYCPDPITTGQLIGKQPGRAWAHAACIVAANRNTSTERAQP